MRLNKIKAYCLGPYKPAVIITALIAVYLIIYYGFNYFFFYTRDAYVNTRVLKITPEVSGTIEKFYIRDLQSVKKGQALFKIKQTPFIAKVALAKANVKAAILKQKQLQDELAAARKKYDTALQALKLQNKQLKRYQALANAENAPIAKLDEVMLNQQQAANNVSIAESVVTQIQNQLGDDKAAFPPLLKAKAQLKYAQFELKHTVVRTPIAGKITAMLSRAGDYATKGTPLFAVVDNKHWWVVAKVKENYLSQLKHQRVSIWLPTSPGVTFKGRITGTAWAINRTEQGGGSALNVLPFLKQDEDWVQLAQRFPVRIDFDTQGKPVRVGTTAKILVHLYDKN